MRFHHDNRYFPTTFSAGLIEVGGRESVLSELLGKADSACFVAKEAGRNRLHVHLDNDEESKKRRLEMGWVARINEAIMSDKLILFQQDIMPLKSSRFGQHMEILVRMEDENGHQIPPGAFLPAAERYNLASKIDHWVIRRTFSEFRNHPEFFKALSICSINLSGQSIGDPSFVNYILSELRSCDLDPTKFCFEITETAAIGNFERGQRFMREMRDSGFHFALDDFGSGLSSFAYLRDLPVDYLKIDGVFVREILDNADDRAIVHAMHQVAGQLGKKTIAEFVENVGILDCLREIGVDYGQGYGIAKPRPLSGT